MTITRRTAAWTRKHDDPAAPVAPSAQILIPDDLADVIALCTDRTWGERLRAGGSHWALSDAALSDGAFIETHDPRDVPGADPGSIVPVMGRTLYGVVPGCLNQAFVDVLFAQEVLPYDDQNVDEDEGLYPVHIETGKRVYQLYSELDAGDDDPRSLAELLAARGNDTYRGEWGFRTLGGAGGQTVFGALTTGTHGGDFRMPPIADSVLALHLVADGGRHYWIEPAAVPRLGVPGMALTDDAELHRLYDPFGDQNDPLRFQVIRDDDRFNAVLVSPGRFGIVYSVVLAAVRQYSLHQERRVTTWQKVRSQIGDPTGALYVGQDQDRAPAMPNRFLQVAICPTPSINPAENRAGVQKRWNVPGVPRGQVPPGRAERRGDRGNVEDPVIRGRRFSHAGNQFVYTPPPVNPDDPVDRGAAAPPSFLEQAGANVDLVLGAIETASEQAIQFVDGSVVAGDSFLGQLIEAGSDFLLQGFKQALRELGELLAGFVLPDHEGPWRLGQVMEEVRRLLLGDPEPMHRLAGITLWRWLVSTVFESQQGEQDYDAISYAMMDGHDYLEESVYPNVDSIEVFFDARNPMLLAYVDMVLAFEAAQELAFGRAFIGYISLRFTGPTRALLGEQRFEVSCAVEVSGLRDTDGVTQLIDFAVLLALNPVFRGILHWGQRNDSRRRHIEERFGSLGLPPSDALDRWRAALRAFTDGGARDRFTSAFTRRTGLEIVTPIIATLTAAVDGDGRTIVVTWACGFNPPATELGLRVAHPDGSSTIVDRLRLDDRQRVETTMDGDHVVTLTAALVVDDERNEVTEERRVTIGP